MPLVQTGVVALPNVKGRIDHLAAEDDRVFVAALDAGELLVVDLKAKVVERTIPDLPTPSGVTLTHSGKQTTLREVRNLVWVSCAGDGSLRSFKLEDYSECGRVTVGPEIDNLRTNGNAVWAGYGEPGNCGLAVVDAASVGVVQRIPLASHPEAFVLAPSRADHLAIEDVLVNLPGEEHLGVVHVATQHVTTWRLPGVRENFPLTMASSGDGARWAVLASRSPATLVVADPATGTVLASMACGADADDLFFDSASRQVILTCGEGAVELFTLPRSFKSGGLERSQRTLTRAGARTGVWSSNPAGGRLVVACPAQGNAPAELRIFERQRAAPTKGKDPAQPTSPKPKDSP